MSIKTKIVLMLSCVLFTVGTVMGLCINWQDTVYVAGVYQADMQKSIINTTKFITSYVDHVEYHLSDLAKDSLVIDALEGKDPKVFAQVSERMTALNDTIGSIENIGLLEVVGSKCILRGGDTLALPSVGTDFSYLDYCQGVIRAKETFISSAFISTITKNAVIAVAVPIYGVQGRMLGFIVGTVGLSDLRAQLLSLQDQSSVVLLDRNGLAFLDTKKIIESLDAPPSAIVTEIQKRLASQAHETYFEYGQSSVGYVSTGQLVVIYEQSSSSLFLRRLLLAQDLFFAVLVGILVTTGMAYIFVGTITKRIRRLSDAAKDMSLGRFTNLISAKDLCVKDEVGILANAFNTMASDLAMLYREMDKRVKQRTDEAVASKGSLKTALETAEKLNRLMIGRELEMVKLKQQVNGAASHAVAIKPQQQVVSSKQHSSEERYSSLFMAAKEAIMTLEPPSWNFTSGNPATLAMFGAKDEAEFMSYEPWRLSPARQPDGRLSSEAAKEKILQAMHDGSCQFEWVHKRINGEEFFAEVVLSKVGEGDPAFLHACVRDITEQKNATESLERFNALMVGRELEMKKLKEQIRELKKKTKTVENNNTIV